MWRRGWGRRRWNACAGCAGREWRAGPGRVRAEPSCAGPGRVRAAPGRVRAELRRTESAPSCAAPSCAAPSCAAPSSRRVAPRRVRAESAPSPRRVAPRRVRAESAPSCAAPSSRRVRAELRRAEFAPSPRRVAPRRVRAESAPPLLRNTARIGATCDLADRDVPAEANSPNSGHCSIRIASLDAALEQSAAWELM